MAKEPIFFTWNGNHMVPNDARDAELCDRFKRGTTVRADRLTMPRNPRRHRYYWAVLQNVVDATGCTATTDHLHDIIKMKTGFVRLYVLPNGEAAYVPDKTSWDRMSEDEFEVFLESALKWIAETFGITAEVLNREAA